MQEVDTPVFESEAQEAIPVGIIATEAMLQALAMVENVVSPPKQTRQTVAEQIRRKKLEELQIETALMDATAIQSVRTTLSRLCAPEASGDGAPFLQNTQEVAPSDLGDQPIASSSVLPQSTP